MKTANPDIWDGRILGFTPPLLGSDGVLRAEAREDAYSAFLTWRRAGFPDVGIAHLFGIALIVSSDNALILGAMGGNTINAGRVYPPGGSFEPRDVGADGCVHPDLCIGAELEEETGLTCKMAQLGGLQMIRDGARIALGRVLRFADTADILVDRIRSNLAAQDERELSDVVACRSAEDGRAAGSLADYAVPLIEMAARGQLR